MALATIYPSVRPQLFTWLASEPTLPTAHDLDVSFIMQGAVLITYNVGPPIAVVAEYIYVNSTVGWIASSMPTIAATVAAGVDVTSIAAGDHNIGNVDLVTLPTANLTPVHVHTITPTVVNASAAQTDIVNIDGVVCSFTSDATPTTAEIVTGLKAAIAASAAAGKFVLSGTTTLILTPAGAYDPVVMVSANLADVVTLGAASLLGVSAQLGASEAHVGETSGWSDLIKVTPVISAGAYSAQDMVGGLITIPNAVRAKGGKSFLYDFWVICTDKIATDLDIHLFSAMAGTYADNGAESISAADALNGLGLIRIKAADYLTKANFAKASPDPTTWKPIMLKAATGSRDIYAIVVAPLTPTYAHTNGLQLNFGVLE